MPILLFPLMLDAGKFTVGVTYAPATVSQEEVMGERAINDNYHRIPVVTPERVYEPESYYVILEGTDQGTPADETVRLRGLSVDRSSVIIKMGGKLLLENEESLARDFTIVDDSGIITKEFTVAPKQSASYNFMRTGNYTFLDNKSPTGKIYVKVLAACTIYPLRGPTLRIEMPTLLPGTYTIKIFYAFKQVFQEDFTMVGDSVLAVNYRIINREVFRDDSTTFTGGRVMPMSTGGDSTQQTIEPSTAGSSRKR
ncbi:MAG TPA: hypothetical protein PLV42_05335 [bacterium]|nr:hypothetical protein [bacterium]